MLRGNCSRGIPASVEFRLYKAGRRVSRVPPTGGGDEEHVEHGRLDRVEFERDDRLREPDQLLLEQVEPGGRRGGCRATLAAGAPRQEVAERASVGVEPVQRGDEHAARRLAETHDRYLVLRVEARETCTDPAHRQLCRADFALPGARHTATGVTERTAECSYSTLSPVSTGMGGLSLAGYTTSVYNQVN